MRKSFSGQGRLDCNGVADVELNLDCRDEIVPILSALQYIYSKPELRDSILKLVASDVNNGTRRDIGREGFSDWEIIVLASVRLGCNLNYDKLQDLAEQHRALRQIMGVGDWDSKTSFNWRRIRNTICLLKPETINKISQLIVSEGHTLDPEAAKKVRADSFVADTNIHYPTESSLLYDGMRKIITICAALSANFGLAGWRQHEHLLKKIKNIHIAIAQISSRKGPHYKTRLKKEYRRLFKRVRRVLNLAKGLQSQLGNQALAPRDMAKTLELQTFIELTEQVHDTARRRVLKGETVPNDDKIFSMFETHTQLYKRGKQAEPVQFGRLVMVYEDDAGFISHHYILSRDEQDSDVTVEQTRIAQSRHGGQITDASFDRGFYSRENEERLNEIIENPCLPKKDRGQFMKQIENASVRFREARKRHPGIESAIGALQFGNGLERCRDKTEIGFERYIALGILGRNLHVLGKILIQRKDPKAKAAESLRKSAA